MNVDKPPLTESASHWNDHLYGIRPRSTSLNEKMMNTKSSHPSTTRQLFVEGEKWKRVEAKRKKQISPAERKVKQKTIGEYWLSSPAQKNRFQVFQENNDVTEEQSSNTTEIKPPPIFVHGVNNITPLTDLADSIAKDEYTIKLIGGSQAKIQLKSSVKYVMLTNELKNRNTEFHSFQHKKNRLFKVVIKNLHHSVNIEELLEEIRSLGHGPIRANNITSKKTKTPLPIFFLEIKQKHNSKEIYGIQYLMRTKIIIEPPFFQTRNFAIHQLP